MQVDTMIPGREQDGTITTPSLVLYLYNLTSTSHFTIGSLYP